ncbi:hypothetical protein [Helicobacter sp. 11S02629-2]|uniref:hypothetical protein n=1 Tax=Helicobacter sp. 11S02629-2 TaxID=1476195 RepID=UPI000BA6DF2A|nr:hypothetical protein [Helicobacter sp. 11S02629-2]PAF42532.1 hypothetical protein BKH40_07770 [Helicobacter sp. 11S02629-2]
MQKSILGIVIFILIGFVVSFLLGLVFGLNFILGALGFIFIILASFKGMQAKSKAKIANAKNIANLEALSKDDLDKKDDKKQEKDFLKALDTSRFSLGVELSFSLFRILAYVFIIASIVILQTFSLFHAVGYIAGISFIVVILIIAYIVKLSIKA